MIMMESINFFLSKRAKKSESDEEKKPLPYLRVA